MQADSSSDFCISLDCSLYTFCQSQGCSESRSISRAFDRSTDGWVDERTDGWMGGWVLGDGWMGRWVVGWKSLGGRVYGWESLDR